MPNAIPDINEYRGYHIFFWSNENKPLEPIHIHICKGKPSKNATKYWINSDGSVEQENNNSQIPISDLKKIERFVTEYSFQIIQHWENYFNEPVKFHNDFNFSKEIEVEMNDYE